AGDLLDCVTTFTGGFVRLDTGTMRSVIGYLHCSAATWFRTGHMFMLEGLDETTANFTFLF
ncbi:MAG: hypothetical protein ABL983_16635, partial [Nitrospira sp.]